MKLRTLIPALILSTSAHATDVRVPIDWPPSHFGTLNISAELSCRFEAHGYWSTTLIVDTGLPPSEGQFFEWSMEIWTANQKINLAPFGSSRATEVDQFFYADHIGLLFQAKDTITIYEVLGVGNSTEYFNGESLDRSMLLAAGRKLVELGCKDAMIVAALGKRSQINTASVRSKPDHTLLKVPQLKIQGKDYALDIRLYNNGSWRIQRLRER